MQLPSFVRHFVHGAIAVVVFAATLLFFAFSGSRQPGEHIFRLGTPETWMVVEQTDSGFEWSINILLAVLLVGFVFGLNALDDWLATLEGRPRKTTYLVMGIWGVLLMIVCSIGLTSTLLHGSRLPVDGPNVGAVQPATTILGGLMLLGLVGSIVGFRTHIQQRRELLPPEDSSAKDTSSVAHSQPFTPGTGPKLLSLALGMVFSLLVTLVGLAMLLYGLLVETHPGSRWGYIGGGIGTQLGGVGGLIGVWQNYRQLRGEGNPMASPHWTALDTALLLVALLGVTLLAAAGLFWSQLGFGGALTAIIIGVNLLGVGGLLSLWRVAARRAHRAESADVLDLRMLLLAGGMLASGLMMLAGLVGIIYGFAVRSLWVGPGFGCFFGGGGALVGCWNSYREMEGAPDIWAAPQRTWFDVTILASGLFGLVSLILGFALSGTWDADLLYVLKLVGGILLFQSVIFGVMRQLVLRGARQEIAADEAEHQT